MQRIIFSLIIMILSSASMSQEVKPYSVVSTVRAGGLGSYDYVYADQAGRRLYIPRTGTEARLSVFDLDTLAIVKEIPNISAMGAAVSTKSGHGFATSNPVAMWDSRTLAPIKTIPVEGKPDGILYDAFNDRVYIFGHTAPEATVINATDGTIVGTLDLGGAAEQAVTDGTGHIYVNIEDKDSIAVIDAKRLSVTGYYGLEGKGGGCAGLAIDVKNQILFAACRKPQTMVMLNAKDGKVIDALPIGQGCDGAQFNPNTMEAFSSQSDGTLSIVKENSPTSFYLEQTVSTFPGAKTLTLDQKTNRILVIAGEFGPAPAPELGKKPSRGELLPDSFKIISIGK